MGSYRWFRCRTWVVALVLAGVAVPALGQTDEADELAEYIKANYTKYEHYIPMRDGARLFTSVYVPKDASREYAIMFLRTPYSVSPYGVDQYRSTLGPSEHFAREGFIFAYQDVRGRYLSDGEFQQMSPHNPTKSSGDVDESTDTYDSIEWMVKNLPNNNGKVGMWGISYPGFYVAAGMIDAHRALKAASPQAPVADFYRGDDWYHNGAFMLAHCFRFFSRFGEREEQEPPPPRLSFDYKTQSAYEFFMDAGPLWRINELYLKGENPYWNEVIEHTTFDDFWRNRDIIPHLRRTPPAVMTVGGWFDAEDPLGPLNVYHAVEAKSRRTSNHLVMGPWFHGGWARSDGEGLGDVRFNAKTSEYYREHIEFPFFKYYLYDEGDGDFPDTWAFETGTNQWRTFDQWPPKAATATRLYFRKDGGLSFEAPDDLAGQDTYVSDPNRPVGFIGYTALGVPRPYMVGDQRFASRRPDVLVYETEVLEEDVAIAGPVTAKLHVTTTGTDCDFIVKLIDVYPHDFPDLEPNPADVRMGGYQQLVRGEPIRAKFRNSLEEPEPMNPGELTYIEYSMPDVSHVFRRGHKIMVHVQSTWFPLVDRNPQTFVDIPRAKPSDFQKAVQTVVRSRDARSGIEVLVLE